MKRILFYILAILFSSCAVAQSTPDSLAVNYTYQLPPLLALVDSAKKHSPLLQKKGEEIKVLAQELKLQRKAWSDYIYLEGSTRYGLFNLISISSESATPSDKVGVQSANEQVNYYAGISIKLPFSGLLKQPNKVKIKKHMLRKNQLELEGIAQEIEKVVTDEYYVLKTLEENTTVAQDILQTLEMSYQKAKHDLKKGQIKLDEFAMLVSTFGKAKQGYNKSRNSFFAQHKRLQIICGVAF